MSVALEAVHGLIALVLFAWVVQASPRLRIQGPWPPLWAAMLSLAVAEALHVGAGYRAVESAFGPGSATLTANLALMGAAVAVFQLLHELLQHSSVTRRRSGGIGAAALLLAALPWLIDPPARAASGQGLVYYDSSWRSITHWSVCLAYLGCTLAYTSWQCRSHAQDLAPTPLRTGLRLISAGTAVGLGYVVGHGAVAVGWYAEAEFAALNLDALIDVLFLSPALVLITLGVTWTRLAGWLDLRAARRQIERIRPIWVELVEQMPEVSPFPDTLQRTAVDPEHLRWQRTRLITETYDALLRLDAYLDNKTRGAILEAVRRRGLRGPAATAAVQQVCVAVCLRRRKQGRPPEMVSRSPLPRAATTASAAGLLAQQTLLAQRRRVREVVTSVLEEGPQ